MENYSQKLKPNSRTLRTNMTDAEQLLWLHIRRKQIQGVQFYRQKPLLNFVVDFYCSTAKLVIELDGSQHIKVAHQSKDNVRDAALASLGLQVLRFDNRQVLLETEAVMEMINRAVTERLNPPYPPFFKVGDKDKVNWQIQRGSDEPSLASTEPAHSYEERILPLRKRGTKGD
jgi:very-short-patch-repair endonuclease